MAPPQFKPGPREAASSSVFLLISHTPSICPPYWPQEASRMQYDHCTHIYTHTHTHTHTPLYLISLSLHFHTSCLKPSFFGPGLSPVLSSLSAWRSLSSFPLGHPALDGAFAACPASSRTTLCFAPPHWGTVPCFGDAPLCVLSLTAL